MNSIVESSTDGGYATGVDIIGNPLVNQREYVPIPIRVLRFASQVNAPVYQENAQRVFGPYHQFDSTWEPEAGPEIYIRGIPHRFGESGLVPILQPSHVGPLFQLCLLMDFSGINKGYCFVKYLNLFQANCALVAMSGFQLNEGCYIVAGKNISGTTNVQLHAIWAAPGTCSKGLAFLKYGSHRVVALALKRMRSNNICLWGVEISTDWAEPDANLMPLGPLLNVICVQNISPFTSEDYLFNFLNCGCGGIEKNERLYNRVYIHFEIGSKQKQPSWC